MFGKRNLRLDKEPGEFAYAWMMANQKQGFDRVRRLRRYLDEGLGTRTIERAVKFTR